MMLHKSAGDEKEQNYESVDSDVICIAMTLYNFFLNFTFNGSGFMFQLSYHVWTAAGLPCISSLFTSTSTSIMVLTVFKT